MQGHMGIQNLNTSHVKVKQSPLYVNYSILLYLNTSHVKVKQNNLH